MTPHTPLIEALKEGREWVQEARYNLGDPPDACDFDNNWQKTLYALRDGVVAQLLKARTEIDNALRIATETTEPDAKKIAEEILDKFDLAHTEFRIDFICNLLAAQSQSPKAIRAEALEDAVRAVETNADISIEAKHVLRIITAIRSLGDRG